ncbi:MAG: response regulator [Nanoarchaeota archaeon]|nr:response regulator [Nanoarchaeota archaeon]
MASKINYEVALTHLKNRQFITAHNLFLNQAESIKKTEHLKSAFLYMLAAECKKRQAKESKDEIEKACDLFLQYSENKKSKNIQGALLCASKCFLSLGKYDKAKISYQKAKTIISSTIEIFRPIVIIDDSKSISLKLKSYVEKLGYQEILIYENGKDGLKGCQKLFSKNKKPIVLLDMGLPDFDGDIIAEKLLKEQLDLQIIVITADEKTTKRVNTTISSGVSAFIQKPFTLDEITKAINIAESEYSLLQ